MLAQPLRITAAVCRLVFEPRAVAHMFGTLRFFTGFGRPCGFCRTGGHLVPYLFHTCSIPVPYLRGRPGPRRGSSQGRSMGTFRTPPHGDHQIIRLCPPTGILGGRELTRLGQGSLSGLTSPGDVPSVPGPWHLPRCGFTTGLVFHPPLEGKALARRSRSRHAEMAA